MVLGGLMLDDRAWFDLIEILAASDFYRTQHQIIFEAMNDLASDDNLLDAVTVAERLTRKGFLDKAGGISYWRNWRSQRWVRATCWPMAKSCANAR